jgi:hypothetical protein
MTYEFTVTPSPLDAVAAQWHWVGRVRRGIWLAYFALGGLILIAYLAVRVLLPAPAGRTPSHDRPLQWSLIVLAVCLIVGTVGPLVNYAVLKRSPAFGPIAYHLDDEGFAARGNGWSKKVAWRTITTCEVCRGAVLLRSGRLRVMYLPARVVTPDLLRWIRARLERVTMGQGA